jgi:hypothetical protein
MITAFLTDTTLCIGCKACEVACKEWNQVPSDGFTFTGFSYDNTAGLGHSTWRHVKFVERMAGATSKSDAPAGYRSNTFRWGLFVRRLQALVEELKSRGMDDAVVYDPMETSVGGTHAIFVLRGQPGDYNLPETPEVPAIHLRAGWSSAAVAAGLMILGAAAAFLMGTTDRPQRR